MHDDAEMPSRVASASAMIRVEVTECFLATSAGSIDEVIRVAPGSRKPYIHSCRPRVAPCRDQEGCRDDGAIAWLTGQASWQHRAYAPSTQAIGGEHG